MIVLFSHHLYKLILFSKVSPLSPIDPIASKLLCGFKEKVTIQFVMRKLEQEVLIMLLEKYKLNK